MSDSTRRDWEASPSSPGFPQGCCGVRAAWLRGGNGRHAGISVPCGSTFDFHGISLRVLTGTAADLWFIAADVCGALGFPVERKGAAHYLPQLGPEERKTHRVSGGIRGNPNVTLISESGLYKLVLRAQRSNPAARKFQDWVTKEVLPAIRKDGGYVMGEEKVRTGEMSEDELVLRAVRP